MISDVLADAVSEIDRYLSDKTFARCYQGELRERIVKLRNAMETVRIELDTPPVSAAANGLRETEAQNDKV